MPTPLLTTKLLVPPVREDLVPRQRLLAMLDEPARPGHVLGLSREKLELAEVA